MDSMYMAPPFLAVAGAQAEAVKQVEGFRRLLWDPKAGLFSHIWDDGRKAFERKAFWGVGNGWAAAGMARVIRALPDGLRADRKRLVGYVREVLDGCLETPASRRPIPRRRRRSEIVRRDQPLPDAGLYDLPGRQGRLAGEGLS
ncbi:MAG: glycoside hydrolase family 88 protein [Candidatus Moduliflexus flocculans]|nr:glycoside hydrolase family 88 protein [Candidatus Moduliflexus flocculans]